MYRQAQTSGVSLHQQLNLHNLTPQILFNIPQIIPDIKQNIQLFLTFCKKHRQFTISMLQLCLDSSYATLELQQNKAVALNVVELLSSDQEALSKFLFDKKHEKEPLQQSVVEEQIPSIVSDAELLFRDDEPAHEWKKNPDAFQKYELIKITLNILNHPEKNETCIGYLNKIYTSLLRRQANKFLQFLSLNQQYTNLIVSQLHHNGIGNILLVVLSSQDKTGEYEYEEFKKQIFEKIVDKILNEVDLNDVFQGTLSLIEEILNTTKQTYYDYFEDFKRCANILVSEKILTKFYNLLTNHEGNPFINSVTYLQMVIRRINTEKEENQNEYYKSSENVPSMNFQHQFLFKQIHNLMTVCEKLILSNIVPSTKIAFLMLLQQLLKSSEAVNPNTNYLTLFKKFTELFIQQKNFGMVKNYLYQLAQITIQQINEEQVGEAIEWLYSDDAPKIQIGKISPFQKGKKFRKDEGLCFMEKILYSLVKKYPKYNEKIIQNQLVKVQSICAKYEIRLAKEVQSQQASNLQNEINFELPKEIQKQKGEKLIGKNNMAIPALKLPSNQQVVVVEQEVKRVEIAEVLNRKLLIDDLKSTKIELPAKFRKKEKQENKENEMGDRLQFFTRHLILF